MGREVIAVYKGIKTTRGDSDNLPTRIHEFVSVDSNQLLRYKDIQLLKKASPIKGGKYILGFEREDLYLPVSILVDGTIFLRETNNRIVSIDQAGNKVNLSDRPVITAMGQATKKHNKKLIAEGKPPIKPIKRRW